MHVCVFSVCQNHQGLIKDCLPGFSCPWISAFVNIKGLLSSEHIHLIFFFFLPHTLFVVPYFLPPGKQQGVAVLLHLSAHPSSFISSPWFEQSLLYIPHLTAFVPVAFLSPRSFRCQVKQRCHHFIPSSQFMSCLICLKTYNPD